MKATRLFYIALVLLTIVRLVIAAHLEISQDEAYYYLWSTHPDWSYFSKGPGVATVIGATTSIFGKSALGIRMLSPLLALASSLLLLHLGTQLVGRRDALWAVAILNLTPIFNAGSVLLTIDPLMMSFWVVAMVAVWKATRLQKNSGLVWWIVAGFAIGLGFLCKYTILLLLVSIVLYLLLVPRLRAELRKPGFWLMLLAILFCSIPVVVWNAQQDWITVRHLVERGSLDSKFGFHPMELIEYIGLHLGVWGPGLALAMIGCAWHLARRFRATPEETFLACCALPVLLLYFGIAINETGEVNWTAPGFIALGVILPTYYRKWRCPVSLKKILAVLTLAGCAILTLFAVNPDLLRVAGLSWSYENDPLRRLRGWEITADHVANLVRDMAEETGEPPFLIGNKYQTAAVLPFYFPPDLPIYKPNAADPPVYDDSDRDHPSNQFAFWPGYSHWRTGPDGEKVQPFLGRNALYIHDGSRRGEAPERILREFRKVELISSISLVRRGDELREWEVFACYDFQMPDP